jgi:hypothetical protein
MLVILIRSPVNTKFVCRPGPEIVPNGVEICIPLTVNDCDVDCPTGIDAVDLGCGLWAFEFGSSTSVLGGSWFISNGGSAVTINGGHYITYQFEESGIYQVGVNAMMAPGCFNNYALITILVEVCDDDCPESLNIVQMGCGYYHFMGWGAAGEVIAWSISDGGQVYNYTTSNNGMFSHSFYTQDATYEICAIYFSDDCPEGVEICEALYVPDCENNCNLELSYTYLGNGLYEFTASGNQDVELLDWNTSSGLSWTDGWVTQQTFEPGTYKVCAMYQENVCDFPLEACVMITVPEPEDCLGLLFTIESELNNNGPSFVSFSLTDANGMQFQGGTILFTELSGFFTGAVCLPNGCYVLDLESPTAFGLDLLDIEVLLEGLPFNGLVNIVQISNNAIQVQINVNSECDFSTGINDDMLANTQVYPVPATDVLNIVIPAGEVVEATVFSTTGQVIYSAQLTQSVQLNVANWASGLYLLKLENNYTTRTQRIQRF